MKKYENFCNCLNVLKTADFALAEENDVYRTGIIEQFGLAFELAWKAMQAVLRAHGVVQAASGSPREILQLGYKHGFIDNADIWLLMLKERNAAIHIYNEDEINELLLLIHDSFIPVFTALEKTLGEKIAGAGGDWE